MPLLLNVMQNANGPEYRKLRVKAMECAGLIGAFSRALGRMFVSFYAHPRVFAAIAVGREIFRPDSRTFVELLMQIQSEAVRQRSYLMC